MINIATVHWQDERWIDVQLSYLERNIKEPFRIYAWLNDIPGDFRHKFHYVSTESVEQHATKLNILADLIYFDSKRDDDWIIFLDGDAFPIADVVGFCRQKLKQYPLIAVQRLENNGDCQPHPCFCLTTVGFWKRIGGDWNRGYTWNDPNGRPVSDVGGNLLEILKREKVEWFPLRRSNRLNLHQLWFGIYEGLIYHHGAGFRTPRSRIDTHIIHVEAQKSWLWPLAVTINRLDPGQRWWRLQRFNPLRKLEYQVLQRNQVISERVLRSIRNDPEFYREFN
jgi:hypothetical protein